MYWFCFVAVPQLDFKLCGQHHFVYVPAVKVFRHTECDKSDYDHQRRTNLSY